MTHRQHWREKARAYRAFGMVVADADLRHALFVAAEVYSREAERVARCGRLAEPSPFTADEARRTALAARQAPGGQEAACGAVTEARIAGMGARRVRRQAATYRARAAALADPVESLALLSLSLTCEALARDIEARAAGPQGDAHSKKIWH